MKNENYSLNEYFSKIKEELRVIRRRRFKLRELESNLRIFKSPILFSRYLVKHGNFNRIYEFREEINNQNKELKEKYAFLRKEYNKRFDHLNNLELIDEYEKKSLRVFDLENRKGDIESIEENICFFNIKKKNQLKRILNEFEKPFGEYARRGRDIEDLLEEMRGRGIDLEMVYTNKIVSSGGRKKKKIKDQIL